MSESIEQMGLDNLQYEPQRLLMESDRLNSELESLVLDNYVVFVENLTCSVHLRSEDKKLGEITVELSDKLRDLCQQTSSFRDKVHQFVNFHKRNRKTLQHHMQLVELLEVPQLVDACARNGFHEEALELANFVNGLERRHLLAAEVKSSDGSKRNGSSVVAGIVDDCHSTLVGLRVQLLQSLTENLSLPKEIQILATLRKLDSLSIDRQLSLDRHGSHSGALSGELLRALFLRSAETRLQMDFLEARGMWLRTLTDKALHSSGNGSNMNMSDTSADHSGLGRTTTVSGAAGSGLGYYGKAIELLEVNRTAWFSIITQFNVLFEDTLEAAHPAHAVLGAWVQAQVQQLLSQLAGLLPHVEDGASLRSILELALSFSGRMQEVGSDFSASLLPLFSGVIIARLAQDWLPIWTNFCSMITTEKTIIEIDDSMREQVVPLYQHQDDSMSVGIEGASAGTARKGSHVEEVAAPVCLMNTPPLAYLQNWLLTCLNLVRECPIWAMRSSVLAQLQDHFIKLCNFLVDKCADIRQKGVKYLATVDSAAATITGKHKATASKNVYSSDAAAVKTLDLIYAAHVAFELIPHVLQCFLLVFDTAVTTSPATPTSSTSSGTTASPRYSSSRSIRNLQDARLRLGGDTAVVHVLQACWDCLSAARLIAVEEPKTLLLHPYAGFVAATEATATVNTSSSIAIGCEDDVDTMDNQNIPNKNNTQSEIVIDSQNSNFNPDTEASHETENQQKEITITGTEDEELVDII